MDAKARNNGTGIALGLVFLSGFAALVYQVLWMKQAGLLFGGKYGPGEAAKPKKSKENKEMSRKCDLCRDVKGGPSCVRACPTGAVIRVSPEELFSRIREGA